MLRTGIIVFVMVVLVLGYYAYVSDKRAIERQNAKVTETDRLLLLDIDNEYPKSPRDTVKLYVKMLQQIYNKDLSDKDLSGMVDQMRLLYAEELLNNAGNTKEEQLSGIKTELTAEDDKKYKLTSYVIDEESQTIYGKAEGKETANLYATYTLLTGNTTSKQVYLYVLVKEDDKWKIIGWRRDSSKEASLSGATTEEQKKQKD